MVTETDEKEVFLVNGIYHHAIELINGEVSIWTKSGTNATLAYVSKEEAIELFTKALKLLQDEETI